MITPLQHKKRLYQDAVIIIVSVLVAIVFIKTGAVHSIVSSLGGPDLLGVLIAGALFTSVFTTAPAIVLLGTLAMYTPIPVLVVVGGLGAMLGDYIIFRFIKTRIVQDLEYILSFSKYRRLKAIFHRRFFHTFFLFLGALVLASPLPDEIGLAMLGISKVNNKTFFVLSFAFNSLGILLIALAAKALG